MTKRSGRRLRDRSTRSHMGSNHVPTRFPLEAYDPSNPFIEKGPIKGFDDDEAKPDFTHLRSFYHVFTIERSNKNIVAKTTFSNHCCTEKYLHNPPDAVNPIGNRDALRRFSSERYRASLMLPSLIKRIDRLDLYVAEKTDNIVCVYDYDRVVYIFFLLIKKTKNSRRSHLLFTIKSAYPISKNKKDNFLRNSKKISFQEICEAYWRRKSEDLWSGIQQSPHLLTRDAEMITRQNP